MENKNNVLIVITLGYVASISFFVEFVRFIAKKNKNIYILMPENPSPSLPYLGENIVVKSYNKKKGFVGLLSILKISLQFIKENKINCIIGFSQIGVIVAKFLKFFNPNAVLIYLNDELWFNDFEKNLSYYPLKFLEKKASKSCDIVITQDLGRGRLLSKINKIKIEDMIFVPNSRTGSSTRQDSTFLHEKIGVSKQKKIILYLGVPHGGHGALRLAQQVEYWRDEFLLVFHFRSHDIEVFKNKVMCFDNQKKIYFSEEEFSYDELPKLYASAYIGLAYYSDKGINSRAICYSSGKINSFLQFGVPVISSNLIGLRWIQNSGAGICIDNIFDVSSSIDVIESEYNNFVDNAYKVFEDKLKIKNQFSDYIQRMEQIIKNRYDR